MFSLMLVYEKSGKRYIIPIEELIGSSLTEEQVKKIKRDALKEIQKAT